MTIDSSLLMPPLSGDSYWRSHPGEWQDDFETWAREYSELVTLHTWSQYSGDRVLGITICKGDASAKPFRLVSAVPHGHEPAPTAALVNFASELLTGSLVDGTPTGLSAEPILDGALITILPDTNSSGRARSPERCWDGLAVDNEEFAKIAFGEAASGERFGRYPEWSHGEHDPRRIGVVYEQLDEDVWAEPNTNLRSTHTRAMDELFATYEYTHYLDMHQHEGREACLLPSVYDDLDEEEQRGFQRWSAEIVDAWNAAGASPEPEPRVPYRGHPRLQFFKDYWSGRCTGMRKLTSEVCNNRDNQTDTPTPMAHQFVMSRAAILGTLAFAGLIESNSG